MRLLFTVCARAGSKGLKNKNVSDFLGRPLCYYTVSVYEDFCKKHSELDCMLVLNTDSSELLRQVKDTGIDFEYVRRKEELAGDNVGKIDVIRDTFLQITNHSNKEGRSFNFVVDLDLTSPIRTVKDIENGLNTILSDPNADCVFSMTDARRSPYFNQVRQCSDGFFKTVINSSIVTRQEAPKVFDMNASIYFYRPEYLLRAKRLFDGNALGFYMKDTAVLDIDSEQDKKFMEIIADYLWREKQ